MAKKIISHFLAVAVGFVFGTQVAKRVASAPASEAPAAAPAAPAAAADAGAAPAPADAGVSDAGL